LEKLKLAAEDVLQRNQMGTIYGGSGCSVCYLYDTGGNVIDTLYPAPGVCDVGSICLSLRPLCHTWSCQ
ncbi:MAG: hypothetical protein WD431_04940, partial [Cyclobacteriaceae bacterium]